MRPLWFEYPMDESTYHIEDQFLVGGDLLVAPVVCEGALRRNVYFPNGNRWISWWTGDVYQGGNEIEIDAPLERLPLFARVGAALPTQPVVQHTGEMNLVPLGITAAVGDVSTKSSFYYDAGDGFDHQDGGFCVAEIEHRKGTLTFKRYGAFSSPRKIGYV